MAAQRSPQLFSRSSPGEAMASPTSVASVSKGGKRIGILYSSGGLGDVGRHAVAAALEYSLADVAFIKVLTRDPSTLNQCDWNCGCTNDHSFSDVDQKRLNVVEVNVETDDLEEHLAGIDAIISCLGNRQVFHGDLVAKAGTQMIVKAANALDIKRIVVLSSVGIGDDWPPFEWRKGRNYLAGLFRTVCWKQYQDLTGAEMAIKCMGRDDLNYLIVRVVSLEEKTVPSGCWFIQKEKFKDWVGPVMAKMDCARFMVQEALSPTLSSRAVVLGSKPGNSPAEDGHGLY